MSLGRRTFLAQGLAGALSAAASARVAGANDRLRIGIIGPGRQGRHLLEDVFEHARDLNVEVAAVCDLWKEHREQAAALVKKAGGPPPAEIGHPDELYAMKDLDGVIIATPDHQHAQQLVQAIEARKDVFCEKPMGNVLAELKRAYRVASASKQIVQLGTQGLSSGKYQAARAFVAAGKLGVVSRVDHAGSFNGSRWRPVEAKNRIREQDTNWKAWLMGHKLRPFDPNLYFEFRLYREFSSGLPDQWLTHAVAGVHHIMDDYFPESVVATGAVAVYKDGRENSDTFHASFRYPRGFLFDFSAMLGNDYPGHSRYYGQNGTLERDGGKTAGYVVRGLGGGKRAERIAADVELPPIEPVNHVRNWLSCMRTRKTPNADLRSGYAHSVAAIMAARAEITGRRQYWDARREEIVERPPTRPPTPSRA